MSVRLTKVGAFAALIAAGACHSAAPPGMVPVAAHEEYCWWAVQRSPLPVDSVINRFAKAFRAVGVAPTSPQSAGDTSWIVASGNDSVRQDSIVRVRAVAFRKGDSTLYRNFVTASGPAISTCQRIAVAAAIPGLTPRNPTGEESMAVWKTGR